MIDVFRKIRNFNIGLSNKIPINNRLIRYVVHLWLFGIIYGVILSPLFLIGQDTFYAFYNLVTFIFIFEITFIYLFNAKPKTSNKLGNARYSETSEVKHLHNTNGVYFGKHKRKEIVKSSTMEGHIFIVGGSGLGKTQGVVLPTLDRWNGSVLAIDIKGELSEKTKLNRRKYNNKVIVYDVEQGKNPYNPIKHADTVPKVQDLARALLPITPEETQPFFKETGQGILSAFILDGNATNKTIGDIAEFICLKPTSEVIEFCRNHDNKIIQMLASSSFDLGEKALGSVMSELKNGLITFATDEQIKKATSKSTWSFKDLEENSTVYIKISEHLLDQYRNLWTVIFSQIMRELSKREEMNDKPILLAIDELYRIGKISSLTNALSTLRSKNVHILGVIQSIAQLDDIYGANKRKIILDNTDYKFILGAKDVDTQEYFSKLVGKKTIQIDSISRDNSLAGLFSSKSSKTTSETSDYLIRPEEWNKLENPILFAPKLQPIQINLTPFWKYFK